MLRRRSYLFAAALFGCLVSPLSSQETAQFPSATSAASGLPYGAPAVEGLGPTDAIPPSGGSAGDGIMLEQCRIVALSEPVLAPMESGLLILGPELGAEVKKDEVIARTDDTIALHQHRIAYRGYMAEKMKLDSDVEIRYATEQAKVLEADYQDAIDANSKGIKDVISPGAIRKRKADWGASKLGIEKSENDRKITKAGAQVKLAEYEAAGAMVKRHQIKSPVTGVIEEVLKHAGEWVTPGEPIARMVQMDRVRVIGRINISKVSNPGRLKGMSVKIQVPSERDGNGEPTSYKAFESKIIHVSATAIGSGREYEIYAEVDNNDRDFWPGALGTRMSLQMQ